MVTATAAIAKSVLGMPASARDVSGLLDRDYRWCAELMIRNFGSAAPSRAEERAWEMLQNHDRGGYDTWTRVAATIRQIWLTRADAA